MSQSSHSPGGVLPVDHLAALPREVRDSVVRLQLDPDDMEARVILYYHCRETLGEGIRSRFGEGEYYSDYQYLEDVAFLRVVKDLHKYDRSKRSLRSSILQYTKWAMGDVHRKLGNRGKDPGGEQGTGMGTGLYAGGHQKLLPESGSMFDQTGRKTYRRLGDNVIQVRGVTMAEDEVGPALVRVHAWRKAQRARDEARRKREEAAARAVPKQVRRPVYRVPPQRNRGENTEIWMGFLQDFFRYLRKEEKGATAPEA